MNRRIFLGSTGMTAMRVLLPTALSVTEADAASQEPFQWRTTDLTLSFEFSGDKLRQKSLIPANYAKTAPQPPASSGVETAIHCRGENSPDPGMKQGVGQPGARLVFIDKKEEQSGKGRRLAVTHSDPVTKLRVESPKRSSYHPASRSRDFGQIKYFQNGKGDYTV